jgi:DNA-binding transcriptional regulator YdaS (Cro superfamily)
MLKEVLARHNLRLVDLARAEGVNKSTVSRWKKVPAERVPGLSRKTGIPRYELRPDLFEAPKKATKMRAAE